MKVGRVGGGGYGIDKRRHPRHDVSRPAQVEIPAVEREFPAELRDISVGGAAIHTDAKLENDQFVNLHVEGMTPVMAQVVRTYEGGAALKFQTDEKAAKRIAAEIDEFA